MRGESLAEPGDEWGSPRAFHESLRLSMLHRSANNHWKDLTMWQNMKVISVAELNISDVGCLVLPMQGCMKTLLDGEVHPRMFLSMGE